MLKTSRGQYYLSLQEESWRLSSAFCNSIRLGDKIQAQKFWDRWIEINKEIQKGKEFTDGLVQESTKE